MLLILTWEDDEQEIDSDNLGRVIGFCAQEDHALPYNTVYENLNFFATIRGIEKEKIPVEIESILIKLKLSSFRDDLVLTLNGGYKRKLSIAIALLNNPKILIMDEPTSGR